MKSINLLLLLLSFSVMGVELKNSSSALVSLTPTKREEFRPQKSFFDAHELAIDCKIKSEKPVNVAVFIKDKDGRYFQSDKNWTLTGDGKIQTLRVQIDKPNSNWRAYSNYAKWSAMQASAIFEVGVSLWCYEAQDIDCEVSNFQVEGKREQAEFKITTIQVEKNAKVGSIVPVKFQLSREYFNPFDPKEIAVDCEWMSPDGKKVIFPAFFNLDYILNYSVTMEEAIASGLPYWELRYLPKQAGTHKFRIIAKDTKSKIVSPWQDIEIKDAPFRGVVQVSKQNNRFFEYANGELFYPIGLNIHANIDYRAEARLGMTPLADCGLNDFEYYFQKCSEAGINCIEIWMASWTFGLEWSSRRYDYYGVGRYNLANANKLDKLLALAEKYGILINLVWDNHGKFSTNLTQEWHENPFNKNSSYVIADGGFIDENVDNIFDNKKFDELFNQRSRYHAARYGQNPNIFSQQLWSEVDLALNVRSKYYADGTAVKWHERVIDEFHKYTPVKHLITTHVCGDYNNNMRHIKFWEIPAVTHLVGDAYRGGNVPFYHQMRLQDEYLKFEGKPRLITEFGGPASGTSNGILEADVHAGLWSSIFQHQAGAPFLWWHDYVILGGRLGHYKGFSNFIKGIDFRDSKYHAREAFVAAELEDIFNPNSLLQHRWQRNLEAMTLVREDELIGWVFNTERVYDWKEKSSNIFDDEYFHNAKLFVPFEFKKGECIIDFYDTESGEIFLTEKLNLDEYLILPPFAIDIAFKIRRVK